MHYVLTDKFVVSADQEKTWEFFSNAENLPIITPPWLGFRITSRQPINMFDGTIIDYTIRWAGFPIHWRTLITDWQPPHMFADLQLKGPYILWLHHHTFKPLKEGGTRCTDRVIYKVPGGPIGRVMNHFVIRHQLLEIFRFRRKAIARHLGWQRALQKDVRIERLY